MKKLIFVLVITVLVIGIVSAQNWGNRGNPQSVTVYGTLQLQNSQIVVVSGNTVYFCPMIGRYVGFIDGLKKGNSVTIEGFTYGNMLQPTKLTAGGQSYAFFANVNGGYDCYYYSEGYCGGFGGGRGMGRCW
jgi:hypothetical protein